jgi:hypothetical protein
LSCTMGVRPMLRLLSAWMGLMRGGDPWLQAP